MESTEWVTESKLAEVRELARKFPEEKDYFKVVSKTNVIGLLDPGEEVCYSNKIKKINLHGWG